MHFMEKIYKFICLSILAVTLALSQPGCKKTDGYNAVVSTDMTKPGPVTNVKIVNFNGGAYITYSLPHSKNILYVQANYQINDKINRQTKSSHYSDRSEEHTSELQSPDHLLCRLLL